MIEIIDESKFEYLDCKVKQLKIKLPFEIDTSKMYLGIDPGTVNLGIAVSYPFGIELYEAKIVRSDDPVQRITFAQRILKACINTFMDGAIAVIESSAFSQSYRQTELAEVRASYVLWCIDHAITPIMVNPGTIRKFVFGSGKTKAEAYWKELPPNSASALACMLYAMDVQLV